MVLPVPGVPQTETNIEHINQSLTEIRSDIREIRNDIRETNSRVDSLNSKIDSNLKWIIGVILASWITTIGAIIGTALTR